MNIYFDMDGTIADLYGVDDWLQYLNEENVYPYATARPMLNMSRLAKLLNKLRAVGHKIYILSWTSRTGSPNYCARIADTKRKWLYTHLKSVEFDGVEIIPYGTPKNEGREGILFDDEIGNRTRWGEGAYEPNKIFEVLTNLLGT